MIKDIERVIHIIETIDKINQFVSTKPHDEVLETAILHKIQIIGEAANHVSDEIKLKYTAVPWRDIVGTRNILVHEYFDVEQNIVWKIVKEHLPSLRVEMGKILKQLEGK